MRCILCGLLIIFLCASGCTTANKSAIPVYVYHHFSPFVIEQQTDLSELFVEYLNRHTSYRWQLVILSRAELNRLRQQGHPAVILWTNPKWFGNTPDLKISEPLLWDADVLVFNRQHPLVGNFPSAILNKSFCAVAGHRYLALEPYFADGSVKVIERNSQSECVQLLMSARVDFIQSEKSNLFTEHTESLKSDIGFIEPAIDNFQRSVLVDDFYGYVLPQLNQVIIDLHKDKQWQQELEKIGESRFVDLFELNLEELMKVEMPE
jgi:polar amino acid transport system substrate-binding protein